MSGRPRGRRLSNVHLDRDVIAAIARSSLRDLPHESIELLTEGAVIRTAAAGSILHRSGGPRFAELVVTGLIRAFVLAPTGRTMTIRYCRPGALMGTGTVFNDSEDRARASTSALVDSRVIALNADTVRTAAEHDIRVTRALLGETSARVAEYINELETSAFGSFRQRLARHLLDIASEQQTSSLLVARVSQEALAGAVGTVREIVVRILRDLRNDGLVRTGRGRVEIMDPVRLDAETYWRPDPL